MFPIVKIIWNEWITPVAIPRENEPSEIMDEEEQVKSYVEAYKWGGATSALQLHHLKELSYMIRPGDVVLDLACGPGPLLLELAEIYPEVRFIGADFSKTMLRYLEDEARRRNLNNVETVCEDIRDLSSLSVRSIDLVITTSALHHLPSEDVVTQVFHRIAKLLKSDGGLYIFDFGQLKSKESRRLCVEEVARLAPSQTVRDYEVSLGAAYPVKAIFKMANLELPKPIISYVSSFVDFFFFLQSKRRANPTKKILDHIKERKKTLDKNLLLEHFALRILRKKRVFY